MQNHLKLLCDFSELNWVFSESRSLEKFLGRLVDMVAEHMQTRVCSLYLFDEAAGELRLQATHGLKAGAAGQVHLREGEGLTGLALAERRPIVTAKASAHPAYRFFGGIDEELYEAFLAQPILRGINRIGVLVLQREENRPFTGDELAVTQTIASQLVNIVENARLLSTPADPARAPLPRAVAAPLPGILRGKPASEGLTAGPVLVRRRHQNLDDYLRSLPPAILDAADFAASLALTEKQLKQIQAEVEEQLSDVASLIFSAHLMMLKDRGLIRRMEEAMAAGASPGAAIVAAAAYYIDRFQKVEDHYIREKADDVRDLALRLLDNLYLQAAGAGEELKGRVVIADQLLPSDILKL
ncbi:MAG: GAF domain-containing protein, partial [Deltaproteobacteria bacterium]|nr:GAF domain-containing protein [Deltaproteobacteria bacterium]